MTDFLRRIAQRALGVSPVVQPVMGSRYAPTPDLSVPPIFPPEDRPSENPAEQTPDRASLLADATSSSSARQIIRPAPPVDAIETAAEPFAIPAAPATTHLNLPSLSESEDAFASPAENTRTRARPRGEGLEQSSTLIVGEPSAVRTELQQPTAQVNDVSANTPPANTAVNSGTIIPREDVSRGPGEVMLQRQEIESASVLSLPSPESTIGAKPASHQGRNSLDDSPAIAPHAEEVFEPSGSRPGTPGRERSAPLTPPFGTEAIDRESSSDKRVAQDRRSDQYSPPSGRDASLINQSASLINQSIARGAEQQLLSSKDAPPPPEKIIRVTIGRIEVRAVAPPSQPVESSAPPAPKLSLDEFLRQHNGSRR